MARIKKKEYENLTKTNIEKVISLLAPTEGKPISKKEACEILNISYNTTRLNKIIEDFHEQQEYSKKRKSQNRGKPATDGEIKELVVDYLTGVGITEIAKSLYRSPSWVKSQLERVGVPTRPANKAERMVIELLPENCCSEDFEKGEIVWSARHHCAAIIEQEMSIDYQAEKPGISDTDYEKKYGSKCYAIYILENVDQSKEFWIGGIEKGGYSAYALAYDLGKLTHLQKYGVDLSRI
jgi:hypothetical protein